MSFSRGHGSRGRSPFWSVLCLSVLCGAFSGSLAATNLLRSGTTMVSSELLEEALPCHSFFPLTSLRYYVVQPPKGTPVQADILYFTGYADSGVNHLPLFDAWAQSGFRVLSFDYPSHGETKAWLPFGGPVALNFFSLKRLAALAMNLEGRLRADRPLILAGWSTGGLEAARLVQAGWYGDRKPAGLILFAPAVSPRLFPGVAGFVTKDTLTDNPLAPLESKIKPRAPGYLTPLFALSMLKESKALREGSFPKGIPVFTIVAGSKDRYVHSEPTIRWIEEQARQGNAFYGYQEESLHALDWAADPLGKNVREFAIATAQSLVAGTVADFGTPGFHE